MAIAVDADMAVEVLGAALSASTSSSELPAGAVIAVRSPEGDDVVRWPAERAGDELG